MPDPVFPQVITKEQIKLGVDVLPNTKAPITPYQPKSPTAAGKLFTRPVSVQVVPSELFLPTDNIPKPRIGNSSITKIPAQAITETIESGSKLGGALKFGGKLVPLGIGVVADVLLTAKPTVSGQQEAEAIRQAEALKLQENALPSLPPLTPLPAPGTNAPISEYNPFDIRPRNRPSDSPLAPRNQPNDSPIRQPSDRVVDSPFPLPFTGGGVNLTRPILEELFKQRESITRLQEDVTLIQEDTIRLQEDVTEIQEEIKLFPPLITSIPPAIEPMIQELITFTGEGLIITNETITKIRTDTYIQVPTAPSTVVSVPIGGGGGVSVPVDSGSFVAVPRSPEFVFSIPQAPSNIISIPKDSGSFISVPEDCQSVVAVPQVCNQVVAVPIINNNFDECCEEIKERLDELFPKIEGSGEIVCGEDEAGNPITTPYQYSNQGLLGLRDQINLNLQVVKNVLDKVCSLQIEYPLVEGELNYFCQTGIDESNNPIIETVEQQYTGSGFTGLQDQIEKLAEINKAILSEVCQFQHEPNCFPVLPDARYEHQKITDQLTITFGEEYPTQNGSLWHIHIPSPIEDLDWCTHFDGLFLQAGSKYSAVYGRIIWADTDTSTSAWFASQESAEMFLSYCLTLTTATPKNPQNPIRLTLNGTSNRTREEAFTIRAVRAVESHYNPESFEPELIRCYAPPRGGCNGA